MGNLKQNILGIIVVILAFIVVGACLYNLFIGVLMLVPFAIGLLLMEKFFDSIDKFNK